MGGGIAQVFVMKGNCVLLYDIKQEFVDKGYANIGNALSKLVGKGHMTQQQKDETLANIHVTTDLKDAAGCSLVLEAIVENINIKKEY